MSWNEKFLELFRRCLSSYQGGKDDFISDYSEDDLSFLSSIGYKPRELFDFVEDLADEGAPTESTALLIASVRRDYFLVVQNGTASPVDSSGVTFPHSAKNSTPSPIFRASSPKRSQNFGANYIQTSCSVAEKTKNSCTKTVTFIRRTSFAIYGRPMATLKRWLTLSANQPHRRES